MTKTLDDMTPEELQECIGMWVDCNLGDMTVPLIFQGWEFSDYPMLMDTEGNKFSTLATRVTPRFDRMRAWNPDGTPVEYDWQYADYTPGINRGFYTAAEVTEKGPELPEGTVVARRQVGEWEAANE